jgi:hypothetical protein
MSQILIAHKIRGKVIYTYRKYYKKVDNLPYLFVFTKKYATFVRLKIKLVSTTLNMLHYIIKHYAEENQPSRVKCL